MKRMFLPRVCLLLALAAASDTGCYAQESGQVPPPAAVAEWPVNLKASITGINRVPYISTYYIEPKVALGKAAVVNYYVTDHDQKEYVKDDASESFTIDYWANGVKQSLPGVKAGDHSITLSGLPEGKVLFALQATDSRGCKSHRLFQEFLIVDPAKEVIPANKVITPDLARFGISNDGTHPVETTKGLTEMLKWASDNGYRKVVLPKGTYLLDENSTVQMATRLTLDMNGATFKLNPNALDKASMFEFTHCFDSHVLNGTFEGDLKNHDFKTAKNNSEWVHGVTIGQDSEYCSLENVKVVDITGYGTTTSIGGYGIRQYSLNSLKATGKFVAGDIDGHGNVVPSELRTTTANPVDISEFVDSLGFFQLGLYLGYQGNPAGNWVYKASFYGADGKFLETIEGYMYRRLYPPKAARTARFTLFSRHFVDTEKQPEFMVFNFRAPYNCAFINVRHENVRCVGMVPSGFNNLLVEGCTFENCGSASARCAFDAEDGWDLMQDLTFRKNTFGANPFNEFLTCAGHNFVMEDNVMKVHMWDRTRSAVFRHNKIKSANFLVSNRNRSGFPRMSANEYRGPVILQSQSKFPDEEFCVRDSTLPPGSRTLISKGVPANMGTFYKCKVESGGIAGKYADCEISKVKNTGGTIHLRHCVVSDSLLTTSGYKLESVIEDSELTNCHVVTQGGSVVILRNNRLTDTECTSGQDWSDGHAFLLSGNTIKSSLDHLVLIGNSYSRVTLEENRVTSTNPQFAAVRLNNPTRSELASQTVSFIGNEFKAAGGVLLDASRLPDPACTLTVKFSDNKLEGLLETNEKLAAASNVKIVRDKPTP